LLLAGLGAEVIRIDDPRHGDPTFSTPPFLGPEGVSLRRINADDVGLAYLKRCRSKKAITLDLKKPAGRALFLRLIEQADVVIENFRPGVMQRLALEFAELQRANPRIVHCSISGYGATGPLSRRKSYDLMVQAASGLMSITGEPEGDACKAGTPLSDGIAGTYAVTGILAALLQRARTGHGQFIDVSMLDCLFSLLFDEPLDCYERLGLPLRQGNRIMRFSPFNCYPTRDGAIVIGAGSEEDWIELLGVIGREDLVKDANYMDRSWRVANNHIVDVIVAAWTRAHSNASALRELDAVDIPCAPVNGVADILKSPQLLSRGMLQPLRFPSLKGDAAALAPGFPIKFSGGDTEFRPAAMPRANNAEIYSGLLQLSLSEIEQLEKAGVI
jgi:crotonobetainyl-CoA:carnitine CoA-transferase CaiB-like acyl-CoA transferase